MTVCSLRFKRKGHYYNRMEHVNFMTSMMICKCLLLVFFFADEPRACIDEHILQEVAQRAFERWPISWTCAASTFIFFRENLKETDAVEMGFDLAFLHCQRGDSEELAGIQKYHAEFLRLADLLTTITLPEVPRVSTGLWKAQSDHACICRKETVGRFSILY